MTPAEALPVCVRALDVVVGVPVMQAASCSGFPPDPGPPDVLVDPADAVLLGGALTQAFVERTKFLAVHAAVVQCSAGAVLIPGMSGMGKSTLTGALLQAGFAYMSDEVAAISRDDGTVSAFPRALALDDRSLAVLGMTRFAGGEGEHIVAIEEFGRIGPPQALPVAIVLAERGDFEAAVWTGTPGDAAASLIKNSFNHFRWPTSSLTTIKRLSVRTAVIHARYQEASALASVLGLRFGVKASAEIDTR